MIVALGDFDINKLIDAVILMAQDQLNVHESNRDKGGLGTHTHLDGWGAAYRNKDGKWTLLKSPKAIDKDPLLETLRQATTNHLILHVRKATVGELCKENSHPFMHTFANGEEIVFCHNGTLREEIVFADTFTPLGSTDSERLFYSILSDFEKKKSHKKAIIENLEQYDNFSKLNTIIATPKHTYVSVKFKEYPIHSQMSILHGEKKTIISSDALQSIKGEWKTLEQGTLITLDNNSTSFTVEKGTFKEQKFTF